MDEKHEKVIQLSLWLRVENNNKYIRGKAKVRARIEDNILHRYGMHKPRKDGWEYTLTVSYRSDEELTRIIYEILQEAESEADMYNCFTEADVQALDGSERSW